MSDQRRACHDEHVIRKGTETKCTGTYAGKVRPGNNAPKGAEIVQCRDGAWAPVKTCDATKNIGCYMIEDPGSGAVNATCVSAFSQGE